MSNPGGSSPGSALPIPSFDAQILSIIAANIGVLTCQAATNMPVAGLHRTAEAFFSNYGDLLLGDAGRVHVCAVGECNASALTNGEPDVRKSLLDTSQPLDVSDGECASHPGSRPARDRGQAATDLVNIYNHKRK
jgi:hypothetical protein